jgi:phosphoserine aminotransferase
VNRVRNLCAGPCMLPIEVLAEVRDELFDLASSGMSLIETSHRSPEYDAVHGEALERLRTVLEVADEADTRYVHLTSNETIEGIQLRALPDVGVPVVVDISSDFVTQPVDWQRVDIVYGGVQMTLGPEGLAVVVIRRNALEGCVTGLPAYLGYSGHAAAGSLLNTPAMFSIYVMAKMLRWIQDRGGLADLAGMAERAARRSGLIYGLTDNSDGFFTGPALPDARSRTNVVFRLASPDLDDRFLAGARQAGLVNLKGHRSVGGFRASIYNAMPDEGVDELAEYMRDFARRAG